MPRLAPLFLALASVAAPQAFDRSKPPASAPIPDFKMPPVAETSLPNGLRVILVEDARFPLVTVRLGFAAGFRFDPADRPGLSETAAALLNEGTATRSSRQIAEELASIGGTLSGGSGPDTLMLSANALSENMGKLLALAADVARNANFPENEIRLRVQNRKQELEAQHSDPGFLALETFTKVVYGQHPYSHIAPTAQSLDRMDRAALLRFQQQFLVPNNAILLVLGRLPGRAETLRLIGEQFGSWPSRPLAVAPEAAVPPARREIVLVDRPGSVQADIYVGRVAITRAQPDYFPLNLASTILGGGASSRMFTDIRETQGFAYDAHSAVDPHKETGSFQAVTQVRNDVFEPALKAVLDHLDAMAAGAVSEQELARSQNFLSGSFLLHLQSQNALAQQLISARLAGLPEDYLAKYTARVRAVTPEQIRDVATRYMASADAAIVVVGDASKVGKSLEKFGKVQVTRAN